MSFNLKKPCKNCPFTADKANSIMLSKGRRESIINGLLKGGDMSFVCHKTLDSDKQVCAGAVAVCRKQGGDMTIAQIAERMGHIARNHYDSAMALSSDNFELGV